MASNRTPRYYEDFEVGDTFEFGTHTVSKTEILEFAEQYDPQPFHVDEQAAQDSMFGGLIASGWHTAAVCMRLLVDGLFENLARAGGRGVDELRWQAPVSPGDELTIRVELTEKHPSEVMPGMGEMHVHVTGRNQRSETVISWTLLGLVEQRDP